MKNMIRLSHNFEYSNIKKKLLSSKDWLVTFSIFKINKLLKWWLSWLSKHSIRNTRGRFTFYTPHVNTSFDSCLLPELAQYLFDIESADTNCLISNVLKIELKVPVRPHSSIETNSNEYGPFWHKDKIHPINKGKHWNVAPTRFSWKRNWWIWQD